MNPTLELLNARVQYEAIKAEAEDMLAVQPRHSRRAELVNQVRRLPIVAVLTRGPRD